MITDRGRAAGRSDDRAWPDDGRTLTVRATVLAVSQTLQHGAPATAQRHIPLDPSAAEGVPERRQHDCLADGAQRAGWVVRCHIWALFNAGSGDPVHSERAALASRVSEVGATNFENCNARGHRILGSSESGYLM
jgi:hypothetical protein